jgi:antitoxin VapB
MSTAKVFMTGRSQAIRLPKEFRFDGTEVEIFRRGDEVVLREKGKTAVDIFDLLASLPDGFLIEWEDTPPQEREDF